MINKTDNFNDKIQQFLLLVYYPFIINFVKMRYQSRTFRSQSYLNKDNKENKENQNLINIKPTRALKPKLSDNLAPNIEKKLSFPENDAPPLIKEEETKLDIKQLYSIQTGQKYSHDIINHYCQQSTSCKDFLQSHGITAPLRAKMVDWVIEVLSSYKMNEDTFFRAVKIMDSFLKNTPTRQQIKDLHLIGVAAMFSACKYQQIYPIKLQTMYDRIARKKFKRTQILEKQSEILAVLNFRMEEVNVYDIVKNVAFEIKLKITEDQKAYFDQILLYLSKMILFSYDLAQEDTKLLASAVYFIGLKTLQQVQSSVRPQERLADVRELLSTNEQKVIEISRKVLQLAKNFSQVYPNLGNLKKFNKFEYKKKSTSARIL